MVYLSIEDTKIVIKELSKSSDAKVKKIIDKIKNPIKRVYVRELKEIERILKKGFKEKRKVKIRYYSPHSDENTTRIIAVYQLHDGVVTGYCYLREDERVFRTDRIKSAALLNEKYSIQKSWKPENVIG